MLALGVLAHASTTFLITVPAYLIPLLHVTQGVPLAQAGMLAAAPSVGICFTLVLWGAFADRFGERVAIAACTGACVLVALLAAWVTGFVWLALVLGLSGAAAGGTNSASGRLVVGWFPRERRGLAMGIRQMSQPLGVAVAALVVPGLAGTSGIPAPFLLVAAVLGALTLACALLIRDAPRAPRAVPLEDGDPAPPASAAEAPGAPGTAPPPPGAAADATDDASGNPYRRSSFLLRIHAVSVLLTVPQYTLATFGLVFLIADQGWSGADAGIAVASAQLVGAVGRVVIGGISDRVGSRTTVIRAVAVLCVVGMLLIGSAGFLGVAVLTLVALVFATLISTADNGLEFTAIAEAAGPGWSGKALGIQNTGQFLMAAAVGPSMGALITVVGYPLAFALVALTPAASLFLVPRRDDVAA